MTQRLVWNFEFSPPKHPPLSDYRTEKDGNLKWEARFFWPANQIVGLWAIDDSLLNLANYQQKHKVDCYYLLPNCNYNIKRRRNELLYKPMIKKSDRAFGFGAKINLDTLNNKETKRKSKTPHIQELSHQALQNGTELLVKKESFVYKFATHPSIKLELARIEVLGTIYFSICVEGKSLFLVESISKDLLGERVTCDYVSFLKELIIP